METVLKLAQLQKRALFHSTNDKNDRDAGVKIGMTQLKGRGVFAIKPFKRGEIVIKGIIEKYLDENNAHASQISKNQWVLHNELVRTVNHSCSPNVGIWENEAGAHDYVAMKDIKIKEEIVSDYDMRNYQISYFPECLCGSDECRKIITGWRDLPDIKKKEYVGFVPAYLLNSDPEKKAVY